MADSLPPPAYGIKSRVIYILLALFLGCLGIQNFYSGNHKHGIIKIVLLLACGLGLIINPIWSIIEIFTVTKDENGLDFK